MVSENILSSENKCYGTVMKYDHGVVSRDWHPPPKNACGGQGPADTGVGGSIIFCRPRSRRLAPIGLRWWWLQSILQLRIGTKTCIQKSGNSISENNRLKPSFVLPLYFIFLNVLQYFWECMNMCKLIVRTYYWDQMTKKRFLKTRRLETMMDDIDWGGGNIEILTSPPPPSQFSAGP